MFLRVTGYVKCIQYPVAMDTECPELLESAEMASVRFTKWLLMANIYAGLCEVKYQLTLVLDLTFVVLWNFKYVFFLSSEMKKISFYIYIFQEMRIHLWLIDFKWNVFEI